jgi:large subunit ribosomal protein L21
MDKTYAVILLQGHQYRVTPNQTLLVDRLSTAKDKQVNHDQILLVVNGERRHLGNPILKNARVTYTVLEHLQGPKVTVSTYKAKSRYRRQLGHRSQLTRIQINTIHP